MTFNIKNSNQSYKIAPELPEIPSSADREFVKNLLVGFAHQNNVHKISTFMQSFERIYNSQLNRGVATIEASILGETRLFLLQRQIGHKRLLKLGVELINLSSPTRDCHCGARLVWDLLYRHEVDLVMIDGAIEMKSIPKR